MAATITIQVNASANSAPLQQMGRDLQALDTGARNASGGFSVMGGAIASALGGAALGAIQTAAGALAGFVGESVNAAGSFEAGMNSFAAAAGNMGQEEIGQFKDLFLSLGKELPVSTADVQAAAIALVKGGLDPAVVSAGALEDSLKFAAAAGMGLEEAAELGVKMLGTFVPVTASAAEQTAFLAESQELMVKAANASTLNVDALGDAMLAAGGQARAVGLDYQDFVTTMGLISPAFGSAAEAGTSFKNFLVRLQPSTAPATEAMRELGLITEEGANVFYDAQGNFLGVENAAAQLQSALTGLSDQQRVQALQTIFGNDAMGAASALAEGGAEAYQLFAQKMAEANGIQAQTAATQQGFNFAMENAKGSIEALQITVGTLLLPVLTELITNVITPGINTVTAMAEAFGGNTEAMAGLSPALQSIVAIVQQAVPLFAANWQPALAAIGAVIAAAVLPALAGFVVAVAPVVAAVAGAIAIGAALYGAWTSNFMGIQQITASALAAVQGVVTSVMGILLEFWNTNGASIMATAQTTWQGIQNIVGTVVAIVGEIVTRVFGTIQGFLTTHGSEIQAVLNTAWANIQTVIDTTINAVQGILNTVLAVIKGDWDTAFNEMKGVVDTVWGGVKTIIENNINLAKDLIQGLIDKLSGPLKDILDDVATFFEPFEGALDGISSVIGNVISLVQSLIDKFAALAGAVPDVLTPGSPTPFEIGMRGIATTLRTETIPAVQGLSGAMQGTGGEARSIYNTTSRSVTVNQTINNGPAGFRQDTAIIRTLAGGI